MKKAIVTGACGFIGKVLTEKLLQSQVEVYAIVVNPDNLNHLKSKNLHIIKAYFEDYLGLSEKFPNDIDVFYHFAWQGTFGDSFKDYTLQLNNAKYSCDAIMLAVNIKAKKFVLASTINTLETIFYLKKDYCEPRYTNIYSTAKIAAEMMGKTLAYNNKIEFNTGLIAMVYGKYNNSKTIQNVVMSNLIYGRESNLISGDTMYDLIHVNEVANAFYHIGTEGKNMKTYYVGHSKLRTFKQIFDDIRSFLNPKGILNYGVYAGENAIDYSIIDREALLKDTSYVEDENFKENIMITAKWIQESGVFK